MSSFVCFSTDVRLPQSMQRSMAAEAEASREARAKVIAAEGEQRASRQLKEAADVIAESPIALQLRYLQTLTQISAEKNSTIIFPVPGKCAWLACSSEMS
jgi:erythrocyte band 7 integral membrane protein